ncbi:FliM/FliN family flagellar motor switch protein [Rhizobium panacihumi]|uniref:FliM/FliN family flagellar motor switch protein n=1 Tax=Rhizobium panacihumi TaxID=2008450 RepID=UPI003D7AEBBD
MNNDASTGHPNSRSAMPATSLELSSPRVRDIPIEVQAVLGKVKVSVSQLMSAKPGEPFWLDKHFGEPVELQVNGKRIGYGEIIADERENIIGIRMISVEADL